MMQQPPRIHLFQGYGIELEYMLVDRDTLKVKPITDELIKHETGAYQSDFENGIVTYSDTTICTVGQKPDTKALKACGWKKVTAPTTYYAHGGTNPQMFRN